MSDINTIEKISEAAAQRPLTMDEALRLVDTENDEAFWALLTGANALRLRYSDQAALCAIVNAKSGRCGEDCSFCAQSAHYHTTIKEYDLIHVEKMITAARAASEMSAQKFSVVVSGRKLSSPELKNVGDFASRLKKETGLSSCASLGVCSETELLELKKTGLRRYHHNMETSRSFYAAICTTRTYDDNREAVLAAKRAGLSVCSGGLFGMGESWEQRVELFMDLRELDVDSVPINFLHPISGTPLENADELCPKDCLKIIALARHILPNRGVVVCGGRERNLRDMQSLIFHAGASGMMIGNYLATKGRQPRDDLQMLKDLGIEIAHSD